jgi:Fe-S cluster assembly protein SufD
MSTAAVESLLERLAPSATGERADRGRAWLARHGLPHRGDEAWKYTPVDDVIRAFEAARPARDHPDGISRALVDDLAGDHGGPRLVCVNGVLAPSLSDLERRPAGVWLGGVDGLRLRSRPTSAADDQPVDGFHALNWVAGCDVAAVIVEPAAVLDEPVHVVHLSTSTEGVGASHPRTVVRVGADSRAHVIETFVGLPGRSVTNASTRIIAAAGAVVTYHRAQDDTAGGVHVGRTSIDQAANSAARVTTIMTGAAIARSAVDVRLAGPGARAALDGLFAPRGEQRHDNVITVDHAASHTTSTQRFRGIVDGDARGSFSGHVIVRPGTRGADASQSSRNLLLSPTAQTDTRPWLEIFADEVRCTHGAAVGRLDDDALFYLRSRGIPLASARTMLVAGFAAEIVDTITPVSLRDRVAVAVARHVSGATT